MKRIYITITLTLLFVFTLKIANSQTNCISKGNYYIDYYYGFPNSFAYFIEQSYNNNFDLTRGLKPDYNTSTFGPIGVRFEYLLTDQIGIGLNVFYASTILTWSDMTYNYNTTVDRYRFVITGNWHFATTPKLDPYFIAHVGYSLYDYYFYQFPNLVGVPPIHPKPDINYNFPVALRIGIGARYFFTERYGINAEIGLGGIIFTAGLTFKL